MVLSKVVSIRTTRANDDQVGEIECRIDRKLEKVWLIDKDENRVVVTLNPIKETITGPEDEAPEWASQTSGLVVRTMTK